jgi:P-type conjugative transfer ATPase TrbB
MTQTGDKISSERLERLLRSSLGPRVCALLDDKACTEVMANSDGFVWVERAGQAHMENTGIVLNDEDRRNAVLLVASQTGQVCSEEHPEVGARLPQSGARFQGWIPPIASAAGFVVRKRAVMLYSLNDYVHSGAMTLKQAQVLQHAVRNRWNIFVVGGTGSGKTTLTNALLAELAQGHDRVVTIEDVAELECLSPNRQAFFTRPGFGTRELVRVIMRARPDRIIVGEVRDGGAYELLKAWNTGHPGGIATIHANSAKDALDRLADLIAEVAPPVPRVIVSTIHLLAFIERSTGGVRRLTELVQPVNYEPVQGYTFKNIKG